MSKIDINYFLSATATWKESMMQNYAKQFGESVRNKTTDKHIAELISEGLAQPEQEPVAWLGFNPRTGAPELANAMPAPSVMRDFKMRPLVYGDTSISPQRRPLTNEELDALAIDEDGLPNSHFEFARAIERAHGIEGEK